MGDRRRVVVVLAVAGASCVVAQALVFAMGQSYESKPEQKAEQKQAQRQATTEEKAAAERRAAQLRQEMTEVEAKFRQQQSQAESEAQRQQAELDAKWKSEREKLQQSKQQELNTTTANAQQREAIEARFRQQEDVLNSKFQEQKQDVESRLRERRSEFQRQAEERKRSINDQLSSVRTGVEATAAQPFERVREQADQIGERYAQREEEARTAQPQEFPESDELAGTITAIDAQEGVLSIDQAPDVSGPNAQALAEESPTELIVDQKTTVMNGQQRLALNSLKVGDQVRIQVVDSQDGRLLARTIMIEQMPGPRVQPRGYP